MTSLTDERLRQLLACIGPSATPREIRGMVQELAVARGLAAADGTQPVTVAPYEASLRKIAGIIHVCCARPWADAEVCAARVIEEFAALPQAPNMPSPCQSG